MSLRDYVQLIKPRIIPLLLFVAIGSAVMAAKAVPSWNVVVGLLIGGTLSSAGALAINSYLEIDIDAGMRRTSKRPLPAKRIVPATTALFVGLALLGLGLVVSYLLLTAIATLFVGLGAFVYIQVYTIWLKPRTSWNIVLGGFAGSCAALAGWYAVTTASPFVAWVLAALVFVWTPSHFWSLAVITESDYSAVGIPMLPSVVGPARAAKFIVANTLILIPVSLLLVPYLLGIGALVYLAGAIVLDAMLLATNIKLLASPTKKNAWLAFKFSSPYLAIIFVIAMIAVLL